MALTKLQFINDAFSQLRISGLTVIPSPANYQTALTRLESMMAQLYSAYNMDIGYDFFTQPANINATTNVEMGYFQMIATNLAVRLCPDFGKEIPPSLAGQASGSLRIAIGQVAQANLRPVQPPRRMPIGSGNTFRGLWWNRFSLPVAEPPVSANTKYMLQGETLDFTEDFSAFLGSATIASFTIVCDPLLTIDTSSNDDPIISYTITAPSSVTNQGGPLQLVQITIVDSLGRTEIRLISFGVYASPTVPSNG